MSFLHRLFTAENHKKLPPAIAFLDTGISPVADFITPENRIIAFRDLVGGRSEPYDDNGHGTHVTIPKRKPSFVKLRLTHGFAPQIYESKTHTPTKTIIRKAPPYSWVCSANLRKQNPHPHENHHS